MNNPSTIRKATSNDLPKFKEIIDLSFPRFFRFFAYHSVSDFDEPTLVLEIDTNVIGFVKLITFQIGIRKYGCILWIAVHPNFRKQGYASKLTEAAMVQLRNEGSQAIFASTQITNKAAQATLYKLGFKRVGFIELWRMFSWQVFAFYNAIWFVPGEIVLIYIA